MNRKLHRAALAVFSLAAIGPGRAADQDCGAIQAELDALPSGGGVVRLGAGTWVCQAPIVLAHSHVRVSGAGRTTRITLAAHANTPVMIIGSAASVPDATVRDVVVESLLIDGNRSAQDYECFGGDCSTSPLRNNGISVRGAEDVLVRSVVVMNAASGGLVTELGSQRVRVEDFEASGSAYDGLAGYATQFSEFSKLYLHDNGAAGLSFDLLFHDNSVSDAVLAANGTVGLFIRDAANNLFTSLRILDAGQHGVFLAQRDLDATTPATANVFTGVVIRNSKGAAFRVNDGSCVANVLSSSVLTGNAGGCVSQVSAGLLTTAGVACQ